MENKKIEQYNANIKHKGRKKCKCGYRSLSGFKGTFGFCAYHWAELMGWKK